MKRNVDRIISVILTVAMLMSIVVVPVSAANALSYDVSLTNSSVTNDVENTVKISLSLKEAVDVCAMGFVVSVPSELELVSIEAAENSDFSYKVNLNTGKAVWDGDEADNGVDFIEYSVKEFAIVTVKIPVGTEKGNYTISISGIEIYSDNLNTEHSTADTVTATITVEDAPAAPASDYTIFYTLAGGTAGTVSGFKGYEVTPGEANQITAEVFMVSNNATVTMQAYDIYLSYNQKLSFVSENLTGKAYGADGTEIKTAGGAVTHIQLVADDGKYVTLPEDEATSLGTIVFDIDDVTAEYAEQLEITLSSSTNIAVADDKGSKTPAVSGGDKGAQVINTYDVTYAANGDGVSNMPDAQKKLYNTPLTLGAAPSRTGHTFAGWSDGTTTYEAGHEYTLNEPLALTAQWTPNAVTVTWNIDGDETEQAVDYGTVPSYTGTPTKDSSVQHDYTFAGWSATDGGEVLNELPAATGNVTYYAVFEATTREYIITFVNEDKTLLQSSKVAYGETPAYTGETPTKAGTAQYTYTFKGWTPEIVAVASEATYTATYSSSVNKYTIKFVNEGGTVLQSSEVEYGQTPTYTGETPTKAADAQYTYTFKGWTPSIAAVNGEATYTATYDKTVNKYTIKFANEDGTELQSSEVAYGETPAYTGATPTKTATAQYTYTFAGWSATDAGEVLDKLPAVTGEATYTAVFTETVNKYTVTWQNEDGSVLWADENVEYGKPTPTAPTPAAKTGYTFSGWTPKVADTVTGNVTYKATYTANTYTVVFFSNNGEDTEVTQGFTYGAEQALQPNNFKAPANHVFAGWALTADGEVKYNDKDTVVNLTAEHNGVFHLYAVWKQNVYQITYQSNPGNIGMSTGNLPGTYDSQVKTDLTEKPTATGYDFASWSCENAGVTIVDGTVTIAEGTTGNIILTANFTPKQYKITYTDESGTTTKEAAYNSTIKLPAAAEKTGYTFDGWYIGDNRVGDAGANYVVKGEVTLVAKYKVNQYTITFDTDGGNEIAAITQDYNTAVTAPSDPAKEGYTFAGWSPEVPATMPAGDMTVKAQWTINQYTITFENTGDSTIAPIKQDYGTGVTAPADPTKTGYTFAGWDKTIPATMPARDMTITAKWTINQYTITFDTVGGTEIAPIEQDYNTAVTAPADPTKTGYTFAGWDKEIPATMPAGDMTVKAQWTINQYTITFDTDGGSEIAAITQDYATAVTAPADPAKAGYTFAGWDVDGDGDYDDSDVIPTTMPAENVTITAKWTINQYTVTFKDGETPIQSDKLDYGAAIVKPADPTKAGYTFAGWSPAVADTVPANDVTYTATWSAVEYSIIFKVPNGTAIDNMTYTIASTDKLPAATGYAMHAFKHWQVTETDNAEGWAPNATINAGTAVTGCYGNVTLTAVWDISLVHAVEDYKYAAAGYVMLRVHATSNTNALHFGGQDKGVDLEMFYTNAPEYALETGKGVFVTLIPKSIVKNEETITLVADGELTEAGIAMLVAGNAAAVEITYDGDVNGDGVVNIADANVVYQMNQAIGGAYYPNLEDLCRLKADMYKQDSEGSAHASIADVDAIITLINGTAPAEDGAQ